MDIQKKSLPDNELEFEITITKAEMQPYLQMAVQEISQSVEIKGFRPGKATYEALASKIGEMSIWQQAADKAIGKTLKSAIEQSNADIATQPKIDVVKLAPNNDFTYKAICVLVPQVTLPDIEHLSVEKTKIDVTEKDIEKTIDEIKQLYKESKSKDEVAVSGDEVKFDLEVFKDNVVIENGVSKDLIVRIGDNKMIPGFEEELVGLKKGDNKEFELTFPTEYYHKPLAGQKAKFKLNVTEVFDVIFPSIDDDFAKKLRFQNVEDLKKEIKQKVQHDKTQKSEQEDETKMIELLIEKSQFNGISPALIDKEVHTMLHELEHQIKSQGMNFSDYLQSIHKTPEILHEEFKPQAQKRVKSAIILHEIAKKENLLATEEEVLNEIEQSKEIYNYDPKKVEMFNSPSYKSYVKNRITNEKTIKFLKEKMLK